MKIQQEIQYIKGHKRQLIPTIFVLLSILWMIGTAKADQTFWPYLQASTKEAKPWVLVDLDKLASCVSLHETKHCTAKGSPTANSRNNCYGIMERGTAKRFKSKQEGTEHFKKMWVRVYGLRYPTYADAKRYSGNDKPKDWYNNVTQCLK